MHTDRHRNRFYHQRGFYPDPPEDRRPSTHSGNNYKANNLKLLLGGNSSTSDGSESRKESRPKPKPSETICVYDWEDLISDELTSSRNQERDSKNRKTDSSRPKDYQKPAKPESTTHNFYSDSIEKSTKRDPPSHHNSRETIKPKAERFGSLVIQRPVKNTLITVKTEPVSDTLAFESDDILDIKIKKLKPATEPEPRNQFSTELSGFGSRQNSEPHKRGDESGLVSNRLETQKLGQNLDTSAIDTVGELSNSLDQSDKPLVIANKLGDITDSPKLHQEAGGQNFDNNITQDSTPVPETECLISSKPSITLQNQTSKSEPVRKEASAGIEIVETQAESQIEYEKKPNRKSRKNTIDEILMEEFQEYDKKQVKKGEEHTRGYDFTVCLPKYNMYFEFNPLLIQPFDL